MNRSLIFFLLGSLALARASGVEQGDATKALEQIKSLAGDWEGSAEWTGARTATYPINASYYITGNGSALVENLVQEGSPVMTSVYHLDGSDLRADDALLWSAKSTTAEG